MATFYSNTSIVYRLRLDLTEQSQNQQNNTTTLAYVLTFEKTNSAYALTRDADCDTFRLNINNGQVNFTGLPAIRLGSGYNSQTITSGTVTIAHNDDGNKTVAFSFSYDPLERLTQYYPASVSGSGTMALTKIIRASVPTISPASLICDGSNSFTITTNRALATYTHTLTYTFGEASGTIAENVGTGTTWTPPLSLLAQIPNAASGTGTITTTTYSDGQVIGTTSVPFTIRTETAVSLSAVTLTETGTNMVTGADTVRYLSAKTVTATTGTFQGATAAQVTVTVGNITKTLTRSGNAWTFAGLTGMTAATYVVTMTDSRGLTRSQTFSGSYYPYTYPTVKSLAVGRDTATSSTGSLQADGEYYNGLNNALTAAISGDQTLAATVSQSSGEWEIDEAMTGLDYDQSFSFTLTVTDSFGQSASKDVSLAVSKWTLWLGKTTVKIQDDLEVAGNIKIGGLSLLDLIYPVGSVLLTTSTDNPATRLGGTWTRQAEGLYLMSASAPDDTASPVYTAGSTGGYSLRTTQPETAGTNGYGLTNASAFQNRVVVTNNDQVNTTDLRPPYLAVYTWIRTA